MAYFPRLALSKPTLMRILFIDTNVFLHCEFFDQLDWRTLVSGEDVTLAICPTVMTQLDNKKLDPSTRVQDRAKQTVKKLSGLLRGSQPAQFRDGCRIWATCEEPQFDLAVRRLSHIASDDVIVACAIQEQGRGSNVALVALDLGIKLKAQSQGIEALDVPDGWRRPEEPSPLERDNQRLRRELDQLRLSKPDLALCIDNDIRTTVTVRQRRALSRDEVARALEAERKKRPFLRDNTLGGLGMSAGRLAAYNSQLETYFGALKEYLPQSHLSFAHLDCCFPLDMWIENSGRATARDIDVFFKTAADGVWVKSAPDRDPQPPTPPAHPMNELSRTLDPIPNLSPLPRRDEPSPNATVTCARPPTSELRFRVGGVNASMMCRLPRVYFQFLSFAAAGSFKAEYAICGDFEPQEGELHIQVIKEEETDPLPA